MQTSRFNAKNIFIIRHGETEWNKQDIYQGKLNSPLTDHGVATARKLSEKLKHEHIHHIFSSPLGRARQTADIISEELSLPYTIITEFHEMHYGLFEGKNKTMLTKDFQEFFTKRNGDTHTKIHTPYPQGENYLDVYKRVYQKVLAVLQHDGTSVIVGHNSLNRIIRGIIMEKPLEAVVDIYQRNNEYIKIDVSERKEYTFLL